MRILPAGFNEGNDLTASSGTGWLPDDLRRRYTRERAPAMLALYTPRVDRAPLPSNTKRSIGNRWKRVWHSSSRGSGAIVYRGHCVCSLADTELDHESC